MAVAASEAAEPLTASSGSFQSNAAAFETCKCQQQLRTLAEAAWQGLADLWVAAAMLEVGALLQGLTGIGSNAGNRSKPSSKLLKAVVALAKGASLPAWQDDVDQPINVPPLPESRSFETDLQWLRRLLSLLLPDGTGFLSQHATAKLAEALAATLAVLTQLLASGPSCIP